MHGTVARVSSSTENLWPQQSSLLLNYCLVWKYFLFVSDATRKARQRSVANGVIISTLSLLMYFELY